MSKLNLLFVLVPFVLVSCGENSTASDSKGSHEEPKIRFIKSNGIRMRIAEMGEGPLVIFLHGFPSCWYSWKHQLPVVAEAGYRAIAHFANCELQAVTSPAELG